MRVLVYGAGVIGCELCHVLKKANHEVTILARGDWLNTLKVNGLVIRHYAQLYTSHDGVCVVGRLCAEDVYDLVFIVMQQEQVETILPVLSRNKSEYFVFVGNNLKAAEMERKLKEKSITHKEAAFGFQNTAGRREEGRVISVHAKVGMTVGGASGELSHEFRHRLRQAFTGVDYTLKKELHMDAWLKSHAAFIMPLCYICYQTNGKLTRASREQKNLCIDAVIEAHKALKALGYPIRPEGEEEYFTKSRRKCYRRISFLLGSPLGRLAISDHAMHATYEMASMDEAFCKLWERAGRNMPAWNRLREESKHYRRKKNG